MTSARGRMRRALYHHQRGYRSLAFVLIGLLAVGTYAFAIRIPDGSVPGWVLHARRTAAATAERGQRVLATARAKRGLKLNPGDRFATGLIGVGSSPVTTDLGSIASHRTSTDPVFAAAMVQLLYQAGVGHGDLVAVGMTGSYPAFDLDVYAAVEAMGARPLVISSVGSSEFGANETRFTWFDMEAILASAGVIHHRSMAVTAGGNLSGSNAVVRRSLADASGRPVLPVLPSSGEVPYRVGLYQKAASGRRIAAWIDVGGASANVGSGSAEAIIPPGLSRPRWTAFQASNLGVTGWMAVRRIPVIALIDVGRLAKLFGVPWDPTLRPHAMDLPPPPAHPLALISALVVLVGVVIGAHVFGVFRVPNWELPPALALAARRVGEGAGETRGAGIDGSVGVPPPFPVAAKGFPR